MLKQTRAAGLVLFFLMNKNMHTAAQTPVTQPIPEMVNHVNVPTMGFKKIYDEDARSWYVIFYANDIIYVQLSVTDPIQQRKIIRNGMELWVDTKGRKNKMTRILFPLNKHATTERPMQPSPPGFNGPGGIEDRSVPDTDNIQMLDKAIALQREMMLTGFKEELNGPQNINHPSGIRLSLYFVGDTLVYNAQLPVNTLTEPILVNSPISIGLVQKGMTMPDFGGGPHGDGGPGGEGEMPPPGGPLPGGDERMRLFQDDIIWYKLTVHHAGILQNK